MPQDLIGKSTQVQVVAWYLGNKPLIWANVDRDLCRHMATPGYTMD